VRAQTGEQQEEALEAAAPLKAEREARRAEYGLNHNALMMTIGGLSRRPCARVQKDPRTPITKFFDRHIRTCRSNHRSRAADEGAENCGMLKDRAESKGAQSPGVSSDLTLRLEYSLCLQAQTEEQQEQTAEQQMEAQKAAARSKAEQKARRADEKASQRERWRLMQVTASCSHMPRFLGCAHGKKVAHAQRSAGTTASIVVSCVALCKGAGVGVASRSG